MPTTAQSANPSQITKPSTHKSLANLPIHYQSCTNLPIRYQSANPSVSLPVQCRLDIPLPINKLTPISQYSTNPVSILIHPTNSSDNQPLGQSDPNPLSIHIHSSQSSKKYSSFSHLHQSPNSRPILANPCQSSSIRTDVSGLPEGTSTIQSQLLSGRHHFRATVRCCHTVNPRTIKCQSISSMMPTVCQSIANPVPVNCQSISNAVPTRCQYGANVNSGPIQQSIINMPILYQSNANPGPICQSITNQPI